MGSRWTHYEEDKYRLPEGFTRIGYDSDSRRYTFKDSHGVLYQGEPGEEYGKLLPMGSTIDKDRPSAFSTSSDGTHPTVSAMSSGSGPPPKTFEDILPPELITSSTMSGYARRTQAGSKPTRSKIMEPVRRSTFPKMHSVVTSLRRSVTSMRKARSSSSKAPYAGLHSVEDEDGRLLIHEERLHPSVDLDGSNAVLT